MFESATLWTIAHQAPLSMGFFRQENWNGLPCPPPGIFPTQESNPCLLTASALAGGCLTTSTAWEAPHDPAIPPLYIYLKETITLTLIFTTYEVADIYAVSREKAMAPHSSTLAWKIPWMEEPGGLQSMGSLRV